MVRFIGMVGHPRRNFMEMASWSRASEHLVNLIGMSDQLKWNNQKKSFRIIRIVEYGDYYLISCNDVEDSRYLYIKSDDKVFIFNVKMAEVFSKINTLSK